MAYFDGIKVGDRVYDMRDGWGSANIVCSPVSPRLLIFFDNGMARQFSLDGQFAPQCPQSLFWDKPEFTPPPRPKRKVKKSLEGWAVVCSGGGAVFFTHESDARAHARDIEAEGWYSVSAIVKLTGTYEVEE